MSDGPRIEWGHRLAADFPGRERMRDRDRIHACLDEHGRPNRVPCANPDVMGYPMDHVWRLVTGWQTGPVPEWRP